MKISSQFDSGNIEVVKATDASDIQLNIRKDSNADFFQWFHFRLIGNQGIPSNIRLMNASEASYPEGWDDYRVCVSYDRISWFRIPTEYVNGELKFSITPEHNSVYFAYFAPFSYEQHLDMVNMAQGSDFCVLESLGETVEGRDIDFLTIGEPTEEKKKIWIIARQHPGESMASWFMSGLIGRLLDEDDAVSRSVLEKAVFYLVPNMNIDGSMAGNLRANAAGANLNREWAEPNEKSSPEVFHVRNKMDEIGVNMMLDIHGDEGLPYNFISCNEGIPSYSKYLKDLEEGFLNKWEEVNPDFQQKEGYPKNEPGKANLMVCAKQVGERYNCMSLTVEMPFKDNANLPDPVFGWSADRAEIFGESVVNPILFICDKL